MPADPSEPPPFLKLTDQPVDVHGVDALGEGFVAEAQQGIQGQTVLFGVHSDVKSGLPHA